MVLRELVITAARQVVEQPGALEGLRHRRAPEGVQHRRQLPEIAQEEELDLRVQGQLRDVGPEAGVQLRDLLDHQPVRMLLRTKRSAVCAPAPRFCTEQ